MPVIARLALILVVSALCSAQAQDTADASATAPSALPTGIDETALAVVPAEDIPSPATVPDEITGRHNPIREDEIGDTRANLLNGMLGITALLDDNSLESSSHPLRDVQYSLVPAIAMRRIRPRASLKVDYTGSVTLDQRFTTRNVVNHALSSDAAFRLGRRLTLDLHQDYSRTSDPFHQYRVAFSDGLLAPGQINNWATTNAAQSLLQARGALQWQFGPHTTLGVVTEGSRLRFERAAVNPTLLPADSLNVRTYIAHRLSRRHSLGASMQAQMLRSIGISSHTRAQAVQLLYVFDVSRRLKLSCYGGPQHLATRAALGQQLPAEATHWFAATGASLAWRAPRSGFRIAYDQSLADGRGITPAVRLQSIESTFSTQLSRSNMITLILGATDNHSLYATAHTLTGFRTVQGAVSFDHQFLPNVWGSVRYGHVQLNRRGPTAIVDTTEHNYFETELNYRFSRPWGR